jgi:hypothetical protein
MKNFEILSIKTNAPERSAQKHAELLPITSYSTREKFEETPVGGKFTAKLSWPKYSKGLAHTSEDYQNHGEYWLVAEYLVL